MSSRLPSAQSQYPQPRQWGDRSRRFGTSAVDPTTGYRLPGEHNQFGRRMGSGSGVAPGNGPDNMTSEAGWRSTFPRPGGSPSSMPGPVVMGGSTPDAMRLLAGKPTPAVNPADTARADGSASTPYGNIAVNYPRPMSGSVAADLPQKPIGSGAVIGAYPAVSAGAGATFPTPLTPRESGAQLGQKITGGIGGIVSGATNAVSGAVDFAKGLVGGPSAAPDAGAIAGNAAAAFPRPGNMGQSVNTMASEEDWRKKFPRNPAQMDVPRQQY